MKRKGSFLIVVGLLFLTAALFLSIYNFHAEKNADAKSNVLYHKLEAIIKEKTESVQDKEKEQSDSVIEPLETPDFILNPDMEMPEVELDGNVYIGTLSIPAFNLTLPVMSQWSYPGLRISPGRYYGSVYSHDLVIAGHNYRAHFSNVKYLQIGDEVYFCDMSGNLFQYQVTEIITLNPYDSQLLISGDWDLTLFTCTTGGAKRVTVRCTLVSNPFYN